MPHQLIQPPALPPSSPVFGASPPVYHDPARLLVPALLSIVAVVALVFVALYVYITTKPWWTEAEVDHLKKYWPVDDPLIEDLRKVRIARARHTPPQTPICAEGWQP